MSDLPDWNTQTQEASVQATSFRYGLDAAKPASPAQGDIWLATDTGYLYVAFTSGSWEKVAKLYLPLGGGTMTGAIAMGNSKITGLGAPAADADAARKLDVDTVNNKLDDCTVATPVRVVGTTYQNTSGKIRFVSVSFVAILPAAAGNAVQEDCYIGATSPPSDALQPWSVSSPGAGSQRVETGGVSFIVPPGYYYKVVQTLGGTSSVSSVYWTEWELH